MTDPYDVPKYVLKVIVYQGEADEPCHAQLAFSPGRPDVDIDTNSMSEALALGLALFAQGLAANSDAEPGAIILTTAFQALQRVGTASDGMSIEFDTPNGPMEFPIDDVPPEFTSE